MKTSNRILLMAAGGLLVFIVIMVIIFRITTANALFEWQRTGERIQATGDKIVRDYDLTDFTELSVAGSWEIKIHRAETCRLTVRAPRSVLDVVEVNTTGRKLQLGIKPGISFAPAYPHIEADISLPVLNRLDGSGTARIDIRDFSLERLDLSFSGAGQLTGTDNRIEQLALECSGAAHIDLSKSTVANARLDVSGAAKLDLTMAGGVLAGEISGIAHVSYRGAVERQEVETSGFASINKKD